VLPIAVDAMGGDRAPAEIVAGAVRAARELGAPVVLVGQPEALATLDTAGVEIVPASEVIGMHEDPALGVRRKKDSSLVRAAEAVRDGRASAMVSAGNTGAAMASALLRMGRLPGVGRPAVAIPVPVPVAGATPTILLDAGANAECTAEWLVQFAQMGSALASLRYGIADPGVALLSIGEEATKGSPVVKEAHALLAAGAGVRFIGNVEGRDIMSDAADVVVTDGFTGNVTLKTMEGSLRALVGAVMGAMQATDETRRAAEVLMPHLLPLYRSLDPDNTGGALLLGVNGVCIISHGSSSSLAIFNAVRVALEMVEGDLVPQLAKVISPV